VIDLLLKGDGAALKGTADVNVRDAKGRSVIFDVAKRGSDQHYLGKLLLEAGADCSVSYYLLE
jgi:hypothetical protein